MSKHVAILISALLGIYSTAWADSLINKSRREIISSFGKPQSSLKASGGEILNYSQGKIVLTEGKVSSVTGKFTIKASVISKPSDHKPTVVETDSTQPAQPAPIPSRRSIQPFRWSTTLADAKNRSVKEGRPILALFTGPDWCGPCQQLEAEVLNTQEFKRLGRKRYIPLKIALYRNTYQAPAAKEQYHRLSKEYGIKGVPNFVILKADGSLDRRPDLFKRRPGITSFLEQTLAALEDTENNSDETGFLIKLGIAGALVGLAFVFLRN